MSAGNREKAAPDRSCVLACRPPASECARRGRRHVPWRTRAGVLVAGALGLCFVPAARADIVNLTTPGSSGSLNGAIYSTAAPHAAGTGFIDSFLRVRRNGTESGYNTSVPSQLFGRDEVAGNFTHDITLGQVGKVTSGGAEYYQFFLDINEPSGGQGPLLSLDDVRIYTSATAHADYKMTLSELGTLRYSMDMGGDNRVELDYDLNPQLQGPGGGSGTGDMVMLVPTALFAGAGSSTFVYLYSRFGVHNHSGDGFEEWWTLTPTLIPLPASAWLGLCGLVGVAGFGVLRRRSQGDAV